MDELSNQLESTLSTAMNFFDGGLADLSGAFQSELSKLDRDSLQLIASLRDEELKQLIFESVTELVNDFDR